MIEIILAEFGKQPNTDNIKKYFPNATISVYTDLPNIVKEDHPRYGWIMNDYWKVKKILQSKAQIAIAMDGDLFIVNKDVEKIIPLVKKFGICLLANPRKLVRVDTLIGAGSDKQLDETNGTGYALNGAVVAVDITNVRVRRLLEKFCEIMEKTPLRAPLVWWRAIWETGINPYILPPNWCVCEEDVGIDNEIILHIGHEKVKEYYSHLCNR